MTATDATVNLHTTIQKGRPEAVFTLSDIITVLASHASNIMLRIIFETMKVKSELEIVDKEQLNFVTGMPIGTRHQMLSHRMLLQKCKRTQQTGVRVLCCSQEGI